MDDLIVVRQQTVFIITQRLRSISDIVIGRIWVDDVTGVVNVPKNDDHGSRSQPILNTPIQRLCQQ